MTTTDCNKVGVGGKTENRFAESPTVISDNQVGSLTLKKLREQDIDAPAPNPDESRRIIIVSHNYFPMLNPRAFRWTAIAERWAQRGKRVDVVCAWGSGLAHYECKNHVHIHRVGDSIVERFRSLLRSKERNLRVTSDTKPDATNSSASPTAATGLIDTLKRALKLVTHTVHDLTWKNLYWPDYAALWSKPAVKKVNSLLNDTWRKENNDTTGVTLITVSDPFSSHVAGKALKRSHPGLNWVVDIGDPFCFRHDTPTNNHALYGSYNYRYESSVFTECDSVSVTTEATRQRYSELFPGAADKIKVVPPLVAQSASSATGSPLGVSSALKALYTGTLYRHIRNPEYLLRLFSALKEKSPDTKVELHFFGPCDDCKAVFELYQSTLGDSLRLHGLMPKDVTVAAMNQADLLLSIGNTSPYQLPSKAVEYAGSSKPILNIASIEDDSSAKFFEGRPNTLTLNTAGNPSFDKQVETLATFLNQNHGCVPASYRDEVIKNHSAETITAEYSKLLTGHKNIARVANLATIAGQE
jgi:glycosyltransferase involved in cell wall biosynthesis